MAVWAVFIIYCSRSIKKIGLDLIDAVAFCLLRFISQVVSVYLNTVIQKKSPGDNFYRLILCLTVLFLIALSTYV